MSARRELAAPVTGELRAAALAAVAEACVLYLPVRGAVGSAGDPIPLVVAALPFVAIYAAATVLACVFRSSRGLPVAAAVLALGIGVAIGDGDITRSAIAVVAGLLVALRVVGLGLRDWHVPLGVELPLGAAALGVEAVIAAVARPEWRLLVSGFVVVFFAASLASRAASVWTVAGTEGLEAGIRSTWLRRAALGAGALLACAVAAAALGVRGGGLDRLGDALGPVVGVLISIVVWVVVQAVRPLFWLVELVGIDPEALRELLESLREPGGVAEAAGRASDGGGAWQRMLGVIVLCLLGVAIYRVLRRARPRTADADRRPPPVGARSAPAAAVEAPRVRSLFRWELPTDAVRRWYAEVLMALRGRDLAKEPWQTPREFLDAVARAFPDGADNFLALTRAYEDVRYGNLRIERRDLRRLREGRAQLLALFAS